MNLEIPRQISEKYTNIKFREYPLGVQIHRRTDSHDAANIIISSSTDLGTPWTPQANVASDLYPGHPPVSF